MIALKRQRQKPTVGPTGDRDSAFLLLRQWRLSTSCWWELEAEDSSSAAEGVARLCRRWKGSTVAANENADVSRLERRGDGRRTREGLRRRRCGRRNPFLRTGARSDPSHWSAGCRSPIRLSVTRLGRFQSQLTVTGTMSPIQAPDWLGFSPRAWISVLRYHTWDRYIWNIFYMVLIEESSLSRFEMYLLLRSMLKNIVNFWLALVQQSNYWNDLFRLNQPYFSLFVLYGPYWTKIGSR